jgi:hypothetical protein
LTEAIDKLADCRWHLNNLSRLTWKSDVLERISKTETTLISLHRLLRQANSDLNKLGSPIIDVSHDLLRDWDAAASSLGLGGTSAERDSHYTAIRAFRALSVALVYLSDAVKVFGGAPDETDESPHSVVLPNPDDIPGQQEAPIITAIHDGKIVIDRSLRAHSALTEDGVDATREYLLDELQEVLDALRHSNCDPRYLQPFERLKRLLSTIAAAQIIAVGMQVSRLERVSVAIEEEVSKPAFLAVCTFVMNLKAFVDQFDEWRRFVENARTPELDSNKDALLAHATAAARKVTSDSDPVEEAIPITLQMLVDLTAQPNETGKRALYGLIRSIENIVSTALRFVLNKAAKLANEIVDRSISNIARIVPLGMMALLVKLSPELRSLAESMASLKWLEQYLPFFERVLSLFK